MRGDSQLSDDAPQYVMTVDRASSSAVAALEDDPFYRSICGASAGDAARRRAILEQYFAYSIQEGSAIGRCVQIADRARGVAVWLLPQPADVQCRAAHDKRVFLEETLDAKGCASYYRIVDFMHARAAAVVPDGAWYLSIVAVDPPAQGQGLGRRLLAPTLAEADRARAPCYLETFNPRALSFYERLGFATVARFAEPTAGAEYAVMVRSPGPLAGGSAP